MKSMFSYCSSLKELNLSNFNTSQVTNMEYMFYNCSSLKELNLSNFNTSQVTNMEYMFSNCSSLKNLDIHNFVIKDGVEINYMFSGCSDDLKNEIRKQNENIKENAFKDPILYSELYEASFEEESIIFPFSIFNFKY